jgi:hypothetical protein
VRSGSKVRSAPLRMGSYSPLAGQRLFNACHSPRKPRDVAQARFAAIGGLDVRENCARCSDGRSRLPWSLRAFQDGVQVFDELVARGLRGLVEERLELSEDWPRHRDPNTRARTRA